MRPLTAALVVAICLAAATGEAGPARPAADAVAEAAQRIPASDRAALIRWVSRLRSVDQLIGPVCAADAPGRDPDRWAIRGTGSILLPLAEARSLRARPPLLLELQDLPPPSEPVRA